MKKNLLKGLLVVCISITAASAAQNNLKACTSCHGEHFEKHALGKSKIVKDMSEEDIKVALDGYKNGTYGGPMKGVMIGQAKKIQDTAHLAKNIKAVANGSSQKPNKTKCLSKLKSIENCVQDANTSKSMQKCRLQLVKFAEKIKSMHNVK